MMESIIAKQSTRLRTFFKFLIGFYLLKIFT